MLPSVVIGGQTVSLYALLITLGGVAAFVVAWRLNARQTPRLNTITMVGTAAWLALGAFVGGKALYLWTVRGSLAALWHAVGDTRLALLTLMSYGFVYYGALLGLMAALGLSARLFHVPWRALAERFVPAWPLAQTFGRLGCFAAGCCYGVPSPIGFVFSRSTIAPTTVRLLPTQLIESVFTLGLAVLLTHRARHNKNTPSPLKLYLAFYAPFRFALECLRGDPRGSWGALSTSQWISLAIVVALIGEAYTSRLRRKA